LYPHLPKTRRPPLVSARRMAGFRRRSNARKVRVCACVCARARVCLCACVCAHARVCACK
jgi:hypothetical protein